MLIYCHLVCIAAANGVIPRPVWFQMIFDYAGLDFYSNIIEKIFWSCNIFISSGVIADEDVH